MWKKFLPLVGVLALVIVAAAVAVLTQKPASPAAQLPEAVQLPPAGAAPTLEPLSPPVQSVQPVPLAGSEQSLGTSAPAGMVPFIVIYDGKSYMPPLAEVKKGASVLFLNQGTGMMWPASAMHPTHAVYPIKGGCIGSTFDACQALPQGESWVFTFSEAGTWKYHDHLNLSASGIITVK